MTSSVAATPATASRPAWVAHALGALAFLAGVWGAIWVAQYVQGRQALAAGTPWAPNTGLFLLAAVAMLPDHVLVAWLLTRGKRLSVSNRVLRSFLVGIATFGACLLLGPRLPEAIARDEGPMLYLLLLTIPTLVVTGVGFGGRQPTRGQQEQNSEGTSA